MHDIEMGIYRRFGRYRDRDEASADLLEYLRLISSHYVGITSVDLGSDPEDGSLSYVNSEHVQMLSNFTSLKTLSLSWCFNVSDARPISSLTYARLLRNLVYAARRSTTQAFLQSQLR